ncbi:DUF5819 family protein [Streptomyces monticola]|uniref:DUF5819 family protein n=1 Tax=Streptomyces monticola TaxID=2666263 RepID=A0ABW2JAK3_9ACTN
MALRRITAAAAAVIAFAGLAHLGVTFLHVAPDNAVSRKYSAEIRDYMEPEFEQGWNLFAPDPPRSDTRLYARARLSSPGGGAETTHWIDIGVDELNELTGNVLPSHKRFMLRKAWYLLLKTHDSEGRSSGRAGVDTQEFMTRLAMMHLSDDVDSARVRHVQVRAETRPLPRPRWERQTAVGRPAVTVFPWWPASRADLPDGGER